MKISPEIKNGLAVVSGILSGVLLALAYESSEAHWRYLNSTEGHLLSMSLVDNDPSHPGAKVWHVNPLVASENGWYTNEQAKRHYSDASNYLVWSLFSALYPAYRIGQLSNRQ